MRLTEKVLPWIEEALEQSAPGEEIDYDWVVTQMVGPDGNPVLMGMVQLHMAGWLVGQRISMAAFLLNPAQASSEAIANVVRQILEMYRTHRSAALAQQGPMNGEGQVAGLTLPPGVDMG